MIGNLIRSNHVLLSKALYHSERLLCQHCGADKWNILRTSIYNKTVLPLSSVSNSKRHYSIDYYDKMMQAVSSGKGKKRGTRKGADKTEEFIRYGSAGMSWPGLNAPISGEKRVKDREDQKKFMGRQIIRSERGWSGTSWPGRHAGVPHGLDGEPVKGFDSVVMEIKRVSHTTKNGKVRSISALVVVGNRNGSIGWAIGKSPAAFTAIRRARNKAVNYLHHIPICDNHTIYHDLKSKVKSTEILFERKVPGYGRRCQRIIKGICELGGIEDIRCKIIGRSTPLTVVRCAFQGLNMQETHQELADRTGKNVVEYRAEQGNRPFIVASPSPEAVLRRLEYERKHKEEDITAAFDPYRGAHRPKSLHDIQGDYEKVLADS